MKHLITIFAAALITVGCSKKDSDQTDTTPKPDTLVQDFDEAEMDAAIATARSRVDEFLQALEANEADSFSVKAPIRDGDETEHFWIVDISFEDGVFSGMIGNEPGIVKNVTAGQA